MSATDGFRISVARGLAWKSATRLLFEVTKLSVAIVLARLLTLNEYGIAGMVLVVLGFEPLLGGTALAAALVRRKHVSQADRNTVFWTNLGVGVLCVAAGLALAGPVARFYGEPQVKWLFAAMSLVFLLSALGSTHASLLVREMNFRALELRAMAGVVVGAVLAVVVALKGYGPWAFVAQQLGMFGTSTLLLWAFAGWRPQLRYSRKSFREVRAFGGDVGGTLALFQLTQNTDNILIGRFLGAAPLGAYALAYNIILVPFSRLASPLQEVLYPVFSRLQDDLPRLAAVWLRALQLVGAVAVPSMLGLMVVAPDVIDVVFGPRWHVAVPVVQILAWVGILTVLQGLNSVVLQAVGRTRPLVRYALAAFVGGLASFVVGLRWGIVGVAGCFAIVCTLLHPVYMTVTARAVGVGLGEYVRAMRGVVEASGLTVAGVLLARTMLLRGGIDAPFRLVVAVLAGAAIYAVACPWRVPVLVEELGRVRARLGRRRAAADLTDRLVGARVHVR